MALTKKQQSRLSILDKKWATGKATKKEILEAMDLDRKRKAQD